MEGLLIHIKFPKKMLFDKSNMRSLSHLISTVILTGKCYILIQNIRNLNLSDIT